MLDWPLWLEYSQWDRYRLKLEFHGAKVRIASCKTLANGKKSLRTLEIDFYSNDDLDRFLDLLGLTET